MKKSIIKTLEPYLSDQYISQNDFDEIVKLAFRNSKNHDNENKNLNIKSRNLNIKFQNLNLKPKNLNIKNKKLNLIRKKHNLKFLKHEIKQKYEVEGHPLDEDQVKAVVACEDAELILAPAGSGKSASLLAKVNYIVNTLKIPAENVLVIAFTRKVVAELKERVGELPAEICTFHSLGNQILKSSPAYTDRKLIKDGIMEKLVTEIITTAIVQNKLPLSELRLFGDSEKMVKLITSVMQLAKNEQITLSDLEARLQRLKPADQPRAAIFTKWYRVAWQIYAEYLEQKGLYDFADMLSLATKLIRESPKGTYHYQYILVDEVQDLSKSKCLMLQALLGNCKRVKLFAVGDDWQSIYRFAGSNLGILKDFEKTFGRTTYHSLIEHTYRFGQPTAMISGKFIKKNRAQSRKKVKIIKGKKTPIKIVLNHQQHSKAPPDYGVVDRYIKKLYVEYGEDFFTKRLQVISRYNRDIYRLVKTETGRYMNAKIVENTEEGIILDWWVPAANRCVQVAYCSMHKSKGITRDIVFVINMNEGDKGMPATRVDDPIMAMMLARPDHYPLAEERRLFYVAITRAKELTIIVSDYRKYSRFVREIAKYLPGETAEEILQTKRPKYK